MIWLIGQLSFELMLDPQTILYWHRESGPHEIIQFLLVLASCVLFAKTLVKGRKTINIWLKAWLGIAAICCFYIAFEEISWGQSFFHWDTPESWQEINNQNETNLHNSSRLLNHIPRYGLMIGILVGGIIIPTLLRLKPTLLPKKISIIYPPINFLPLGLITIYIIVMHKMSKMFFETKLFERSSEIEEIFMFFFVFLYAIVLKRRVMKEIG